MMIHLCLCYWFSNIALGLTGAKPGDGLASSKLVSKLLHLLFLNQFYVIYF